MPKKSSSAPVKKRAVKKAARKTVVRKTVRKTAVKKTSLKKRSASTTAKRPVAAKKPVAAKAATTKRPRAKVLNEHPGNLRADAFDHEAIEAIARSKAKADRAARVRRFTATDVSVAASVSSADTPAGSMIERVSTAIERELIKIERIVGNPERLAPAHRIETESRARVLASLARTLKEVMRLREQERGAGGDNAKADDDAVPRDLDEFRRELSRRLEGLVAPAAPVSAGGDEPGRDGAGAVALGCFRT